MVGRVAVYGAAVREGFRVSKP